MASKRYTNKYKTGIKNKNKRKTKKTIKFVKRGGSNNVTPEAVQEASATTTNVTTVKNPAASEATPAVPESAPAAPASPEAAPASETTNVKQNEKKENKPNESKANNEISNEERNEIRKARNANNKYDSVIYFYDIVEKPSNYDTNKSDTNRILKSLRMAVNKYEKDDLKHVKLIGLFDNLTDKDKDLKMSVRFRNKTKKNNNVRIKTKFTFTGFRIEGLNLEKDIVIKMDSEGNISMNFILEALKKIVVAILPEQFAMYHNIFFEIITNHYKKLMTAIRPSFIKIYNNPDYMKTLLLKIFNKEHFELFKNKISSKTVIFRAQGQDTDLKDENKVKTKINLFITELLDIFFTILNKIKKEEDEENDPVTPKPPIQYTKITINDINEFFRIITSSFLLIFPSLQTTTTTTTTI